MKSEKVFFRYLRQPTPTDRMKMSDGFIYLNRAMIVFGWLPPAKNSRYSYFGIYKFVKVFFVACCLYLNVGLFITYLREFNTFTLGELFSSFQPGLNCPAAFIKGIATLINAWRLTKLQEMLDQMNKRCVKDEEHLAVHRSARLCNIAYLLYLICYSSFGLLTVFGALLRGQTPWKIYNPYFDWRTSTFNLWIASLFETLFMGTGIMYNHVIDSYPLVFGLLLRLNIDLLKKRIKSLRTDSNKIEEQSYEDLKNCIEDHKQILDACEIVRPCLSQVIFTQFVFVGLLFGLTMINIMFFLTFWTAIPTILYVLALTMQTFPFCYICTLIESDCDDLALIIFHSNWLDASPRYKSTLRHFIHNVQQNITFTAGSIFPISLKTNISVAKLAFSVVTFVKQMNIFEDFVAK